MDRIEAKTPSAIDHLWRLAFRVAFRMLLAWWRVRRPTTRGVYVAVRCDGRLLVIENSYKRPWTLPCGMLGRGEEPLRCAARELHEETGLAVEPAALSLWGEPVVHHENKIDHVSIFTLDLDARPEVRPDGREVVSAAWAAPEELAGLGLSAPLAHYLSRTSISTVAAATASRENGIGTPSPEIHSGT